MARARANCICRVCGESFEKVKHCYSRREADNWKEWAESNYILCPQCWGKEQQAKRDAEPITFYAAVNPYDDDKPFVLYFSGGTKPRKDDIKALGYYWGELPLTGTFGALSMSRPPMVWYKTVSYPNFETEVKKVEASGIAEKVENKISEIDLAVFAKNYKEKMEKHEAIQAEIAKLKKPEVPAVYAESIKGKRWNGKIYGRKGAFRIYLNNEEAYITDEQAKELKQYHADKKAYQEAIREMEKEWSKYAKERIWD